MFLFLFGVCGSLSNWGWSLFKFGVSGELKPVGVAAVTAVDEEDLRVTNDASSSLEVIDVVLSAPKSKIDFEEEEEGADDFDTDIETVDPLSIESSKKGLHDLSEDVVDEDETIVDELDTFVDAVDIFGGTVDVAVFEAVLVDTVVVVEVDLVFVLAVVVVFVFVPVREGLLR